jgi:hypothetical protein
MLINDSSDSVTSSESYGGIAKGMLDFPGINLLCLDLRDLKYLSIKILHLAKFSSFIFITYVHIFIVLFIINGF